MRMRAIPILLVAAAAWIVAWRLIKPLRDSAFGYELGSAAWLTPTHISLIGWAALLSSLLGVSLFVFDFARWITRKKP
jgi:hypothetical protein